MPENPDSAAPAASPADSAEDFAFATALRRAADGLPPADGAALVSGGYARGRRLRRNRAAVVTAGVAVLAFAGAGGVLATTASHGAGPQESGVAAAPSRAATATHTQPAATPARARPVSARQMENLLISLLPHGTISGRVGRGTDDPLPPYAHLVFDDGHGASAVEVIVEKDGAAAPDCAGARAAGDWCSRTHVHGGTLTLLKTYEYPDHRADTKEWLAEFQTKDGAFVTVSEWNAAAEKGAPVSRPEPPLSVARLGAIATSGTWDRVIGAL
jgi:hypothetical protein